MAQIFLSYRRSDSGYVTKLLSDKLQERFGRSSVFFDRDTIPLGVDFREFIGNAVGKCDVLLAIIGDQWIDGRGKRRIDDPSDFVRVEVESALKRNIPVIPVLVDEVKMPSADDLPPSIQSIVYRHATELRVGDLYQDIELLIRDLESKFGPGNVTDGKATPEKDPVHDTKQAKVSNKAGAPSDLLEDIRKSLEGFTDKSVFVGTIPPKKLNNAITAYAPQVSPADVLLLYDNTVFGSAKNGLLLTAEAVYWRNDGQPDRLSYAEIRKVDVLKYSVSAAIVLNEKEILIQVADDLDKLTKSLANVIRHLTKG